MKSKIDIINTFNFYPNPKDRYIFEPWWRRILIKLRLAKEQPWYLRTKVISLDKLNK